MKTMYGKMQFNTNSEKFQKNVKHVPQKFRTSSWRIKNKTRKTQFSSSSQLVPKTEQKGCNKRKYVPFVPFSFFTVPKKTAP